MAEVSTHPSWFAWVGLAHLVEWEKFTQSLGPGKYKPVVSDLLTAVPCTLLLLAMRLCFERWLMQPVGRRLRLSEHRASFPSSLRSLSPSLESHYRRTKRPDSQQLSRLSQELGFSEKSIDNWFRIRRNMDKPSMLNRFTEGAWFALYYTVALVYGLYVQWHEPYFWDSEQLWTDWPQHEVSNKIYWYYMLQLGYYFSSLATLAFDVRRKDFGEMVAHHLVTIFLILLSWMLNFVRVGCLTLIIHDAVDPLLNMGKLFQYLGLTAVSDGFFVVFLVVWILTRLILLPYRVVYSVYADSLRLLHLPVNVAYCLFLAGFCALQILHFVWTWYIGRILLLILKHGQSAEDIRSDSEVEDHDKEIKKKDQ